MCGLYAATISGAAGKSEHYQLASPAEEFSVAAFFVENFSGAGHSVINKRGRLGGKGGDGRQYCIPWGFRAACIPSGGFMLESPAITTSKALLGGLLA